MQSNIGGSGEICDIWETTILDRGNKPVREDLWYISHASWLDTCNELTSFMSESQILTFFIFLFFTAFYFYFILFLFYLGFGVIVVYYSHTFFYISYNIVKVMIT